MPSSERMRTCLNYLLCDFVGDENSSFFKQQGYRTDYRNQMPNTRVCFWFVHKSMMPNGAVRNKWNLGLNLLKLSYINVVAGFSQTDAIIKIWCWQQPPNNNWDSQKCAAVERHWVLRLRHNEIQKIHGWGWYFEGEGSPQDLEPWSAFKSKTWSSGLRITAWLLSQIYHQRPWLSQIT